jgi:hypothetical protein
MTIIFDIGMVKNGNIFTTSSINFIYLLFCIVK